MRIGIKIPNELIERIKPFKDVINVSQICRDALEGWADACERVTSKGNAETIRAAADMLWKEQARTAVCWELLGLEDAKTYFQEATPDEVDQLYYKFSFLEKQGRPEVIVNMARHLPRGKNNFTERSREHDDWFESQWELDSKTDHYAKARQEYDRGWLFYILSIRNLLNERADADRLAYKASLQKARAAIRLPSQLATD